MIDTKIHVAIKSYKRPGRVKTLAVFPFAYIWVPESQGDEYKSFYGDRVITIPDNEDGNLCRKQNSILNRSPLPWTLILDDDITCLGMHEDGKDIHLPPDHLRDMIEHHFLLAFELGVNLWGVNQKFDPLLYDTCNPYSFTTPILGPFHGHLETDLRYDENALGKDDYDFWLQTILKYRFTLRAEKYYYYHDHGKAKGGFVGMRTMEVEKSGVDFMIKKWGGRVIRPGGSAGGRQATGKNILNTFITTSIPGA